MQYTEDQNKKETQLETALQKLLPSCEVQVWHPTACTHIEIASEKTITLPAEAMELLPAIIGIDASFHHVGSYNHLTLKVKIEG